MCLPQQGSRSECSSGASPSAAELSEQIFCCMRLSEVCMPRCELPALGHYKFALVLCALVPSQHLGSHCTGQDKQPASSFRETYRNLRLYACHLEGVAMIFC